MNYKIIFPLLTLIGFLTSCNSYKIKVYSLSRNIEYAETNGKERLYDFLAERFFSFYFEKYSRNKTIPYSTIVKIDEL